MILQTLLLKKKLVWKTFSEKLKLIWLFYSQTREKVSEEISRSYHNNGRLHTDFRVVSLPNGGTYRESRVYFPNGSISCKSQRIKYSGTEYIRFIGWSYRGRRELDFAAHNNESLYFKYYKEYYLKSIGDINAQTA